MSIKPPDPFINLPAPIKKPEPIKPRLRFRIRERGENGKETPTERVLTHIEPPNPISTTGSFYQRQKQEEAELKKTAKTLAHKALRLFSSREANKGTKRTEDASFQNHLIHFLISHPSINYRAILDAIHEEQQKLPEGQTAFTRGYATWEALSLAGTEAVLSEARRLLNPQTVPVDHLRTIATNDHLDAGNQIDLVCIDYGPEGRVSIDLIQVKKSEFKTTENGKTPEQQIDDIHRAHQSYVDSVLSLSENRAILEPAWHERLTRIEQKDSEDHAETIHVSTTLEDALLAYLSIPDSSTQTKDRASRFQEITEAVQNLSLDPSTLIHLLLCAKSKERVTQAIEWNDPSTSVQADRVLEIYTELQEWARHMEPILVPEQERVPTDLLSYQGMISHGPHVVFQSVILHGNKRASRIMHSRLAN